MESTTQLDRKATGRRHYVKRSCTGLPALVGIVLVLWLAPWQVSAAVVALAGLAGLHEYGVLVGRTVGRRVPFALLAVPGLLIPVGAAVGGGMGQNLMLAASAVLAMGVALYRAGQDAREKMHIAGLAIFGVVWISWFFSHIILILTLPGGQGWLLYLLLVIAFNDTCAFFAGTLLGRHPLLAGVSPHKTVEGGLGGLAGGVAGALLFWQVFPELAEGEGLGYLLLLSVPLVVLGQMGDYLESLVKRMAGVKDSGTFLPGHGGFLDRMDSLLLTPPCLYYYLVLVH